MKNYIIGFLIICTAVSVSFIYKIERKLPLQHFPIPPTNDSQVDNPLYLLLFFSIENCKDCLGVIDVLNRISAPFIVYGIVPGKELKKENQLRKVTGAAFELISAERFKRYAPLYAPTLMGVSQKGRIFFIIPGVPNQKINLENFLINFYNKAYALLLY